MLFILGHLGLADAIFASSYLLAQLPGGAFPAESNSTGVLCRTSAIANEFGGIAICAWVSVFAWHLHRGLVSVAAIGITWIASAAIWSGIALLVTLIAALVYAPQHAFEPEPSMPWCHWGAKLGVASLVQALVTICTMLYTVVIACLVQRHFILARRALPVGSRTSDLHAHVNSRLSSYLLAFLVCQIPALLHRLFELYTADSPAALIAAHAVTHPLQGALNALVYVKHAFPQRDKREGSRLGSALCVPCSMCAPCWSRAGVRPRAHMSESAISATSCSNESLSLPLTRGSPHRYEADGDPTRQLFDVHVLPQPPEPPPGDAQPVHS